MLFALGPFRIRLDTQALERLEDHETARIAPMGRARTMPTKQILGPGDRTGHARRHDLQGGALARWSRPDQGPARPGLRRGKRLPLIARSGHFYGFYLIGELTAETTHVLPNGSFQKITTRITLTRAPDGFSLSGVQVF